ncbi:N-sulfoglucosamine sulfohydrolase [Pseudocercospora fuligena]|uniref:N-sulfoglucosamine sulfohydrolase n=1 Tax=Pseudocercospora fuligena TaxID=685502 RepID=A0A8H6RSE8_9PEZI|nr:N-sulfoglucosamine sulfohydrolase [Pseudocercospora fuligena]
MPSDDNNNESGDIKSHKNILLLIADDLGLNFVGAYGNKTIKTPHLDHLASKGSLFTHAFASTASCSGSRSTIYTGLHTHENGQYGLNWFRSHFQTFDHIESAPALLNHAGYKTGIVGKIHVGPENVYPWTVRAESETRDVRWNAQRSEAFFETAKKEDRPFFLTVGFIDPHRDIATRGEFGNKTEGPDLPKVDEDEVQIPHWITDLPQTRQEFVEYYKAINRTDAGVGMILEALERQGLADSTLIVFTSDNGPPFLNSKTTLYDAGIHLPLLVRKPGAQAGVRNPNMVSFIDIVPTFLDWAGLDLDLRLPESRSPPRRGKSFLEIVDTEEELSEDRWQQEIFGSHTFHEMQNYWPTRVLRTKRYKYHRNVAWRLDFPFAADLYASLSFDGIRKMKPEAMVGKRSLKSYLFRPAEELYDLEQDPEEINNLASDESHNTLLFHMREKVSEWQKLTGDLWLYRDGQSVTVLTRYANDGLQVPDRLDFDADDPAAADIPATKHLDVDAYSRGIGKFMPTR